MAQPHMIDDMDLKIMKRLELDARISTMSIWQKPCISRQAPAWWTLDVVKDAER